MRRTMIAVVAAFAVASTAVAIAQSNAAQSGAPYPVTREGAQDLPNFTVFRPADMSAVGTAGAPVVLWANGACKLSHYSYMGYLTGLAQAGYVVIAYGGPAETDSTGGTVDAKRLIPALDWVESAAARAQLGAGLDPARVAVAGTSCGGLEALLAARDRRVDAVLGLNTGFPNTLVPGMGGDTSAIEPVSVPTLLVNGGKTDVAYENSIRNFERLSTRAVLLSNDQAGHSGYVWGGLREGMPDTPMLVDAIRFSTAWLDFILKGYKSAGELFLGTECGYCTREHWSVRAKNF